MCVFVLRLCVFAPSRFRSLRAVLCLFAALLRFSAVSKKHKNKGGVRENQEQKQNQNIILLCVGGRVCFFSPSRFRILRVVLHIWFVVALLGGFKKNK